MSRQLVITMKLPTNLLLTAIGLLAFTGASLATTPGTDNANQAPYADGWQTGDNGAATGAAFTGWSLSASTTGTASASGFFIGDSTGLNSPGADINVSSKSFGMYAGLNGGGGTANADAYD